MRLKLKSVSLATVLCVLLLSPILISGRKDNSSSFDRTINNGIKNAQGISNASKQSLILEAHNLYDSLRLKSFGLTSKAFEYAWRGYQYLKDQGKLKNDQIISICDFSQSSRKKRLYIINLEEMKVLVNTYVAHGRNSGGEFARSFSNNPESHKSSLGFYITQKTYYGEHGLALKIDGLERGINDKANERNIVIHGSDYVGDNFLRSNRFNGRSFGCPAIPVKQSPKIINTIKDGSCLFIYHPTKQYLSRSAILNG